MQHVLHLATRARPNKFRNKRCNCNNVTNICARCYNLQTLIADCRNLFTSQSIASQIESSKHSVTRARVALPRVTLHVSQHMPWFYSCSSGVALHPCLEGPVTPVMLQLPVVSQVKLPVKMLRYRGFGSYTVTLRCATKFPDCFPQ